MSTKHKNRGREKERRRRNFLKTLGAGSAATTVAMDIEWDFVQVQLNYIDWLHASGWNTNAEYPERKPSRR